MLRGDNVKDDECKAVFAEQEASASQVAAARFLDTISSPPGRRSQCCGIEHASTCVGSSQIAAVTGKNAPEVWIRRRPNMWDSIEEPVVPRERNLYDPPLAELLWKGRLALLWKRNVLTSIENDNCSCPCMWMTSMMVGTKENLGPTWIILRRVFNLEYEIPLLHQENSGCSQRGAEVDHEAVQANIHRFRRITTTVVTKGKHNKM